MSGGETAVKCFREDVQWERWDVLFFTDYHCQRLLISSFSPPSICLPLEAHFSPFMITGIYAPFCWILVFCFFAFLSCFHDLKVGNNAILIEPQSNERTPNPALPKPHVGRSLSIHPSLILLVFL